jgi:hypothetical protein
MKANAFAKLMDIIRALEAAQIHFTVSYHRYEAVSILATVPGERWEIDVLEDGDVDFERFVSTGGVTGEGDLTGAIARFAEPVAEGRE